MRYNRHQQSVHEVDLSEEGKMDEHTEIRRFDKGQIVTTRLLDQNISKTAGIVESGGAAAACSGQLLPIVIHERTIN